MDQSTLAKVREKVREYLSQGKSLEEIRQSLRNAGYTEEEIEEILKGMYGGAAPQPSQAAPAASSGISPLLIIGVIAAIAVIAAVFMTGGGGPAVPDAIPPHVEPEETPPPEAEPEETPGTEPAAPFGAAEGPWREEPPAPGPIPARCAEKELKEECIKQEAVKQGDAGVCAAFMNEDSWRDWDLPYDTVKNQYQTYYSQCVEDVAVDQLDTQICKDVVGSFFFTECVGSIVAETQDPDECEILEYSERAYEPCIYGLAEFQKDTSLCEYVRGTSPLSWETCHIRIARAADDASYCEPIRDSSMYDACVAQA